MAYCRMSDDCDVNLYNDGEAFVFSGPLPVSGGTSNHDIRCVHPSEALDQLVLLGEAGLRISFGAVVRLAEDILVAKGLVVEEDRDLGHSLPPALAWEHLEKNFKNVSPQAIEAVINATMNDVRPSLEGMKDLSSVQHLAEWGHWLHILELGMTCVLEQNRPVFRFLPSSVAQLEQRTLRAMTLPEPVQPADDGIPSSDSDTLDDYQRKRL